MMGYTGKITISVEIEQGDEAFTLELSNSDWRTGGNPAFIAGEFAGAAAEISKRLESHVVQEFGDTRARREPA